MTLSADEHRKSLGRFGETFCCAELRRRGYTILGRNLRFRSGEIDVLAQEGEELVFVEVKTRRHSSVFPPEDAITDDRMTHLEGAIAEYLEAHGVRPYRIEVVAIDVDRSGRVTRCDVQRDLGLR